MRSLSFPLSLSSLNATISLLLMIPSGEPKLRANPFRYRDKFGVRRNSVLCFLYPTYQVKALHTFLRVVSVTVVED